MCKLNKDQLKAVRAPFVPVLVIAGAGTGKTRVLVERIIYLINSGISEDQILVITFTNKAKDEIQERVLNSLGKRIRNVYTFHGFFKIIMTRDICKLNEEYENFKISDSSHKRILLEQIFKQLNWDRSIIKSSSIEKMISAKKNLGIIRKDKSLEMKKYDFYILYDRYEKELRDGNFFDFDDILLIAGKLLEINEVKEYWSNLFKAILVDEFQDTSDLQFNVLLKLINTEIPNIFCVGDPDQSIYRFRYANPKVFEKFIKIFDKNLISIKLKENYRSTKNILDFSNNFLKRFDSKFYKQLKTNNGTGAPVVYSVFFDQYSEVYWVCDQIEKLVKKEGVLLSDIAVIYRTNIISNRWEIELKNRKIPYELNSSFSFLSRLEIRFVINYLNLIFYDEFVYSWILELTKIKPIGIGMKTWAKFNKWVKSNNYSFSEAVSNIEKFDFPKNYKSKIVSFWSSIEKLKKLKDLNFSDLVMEIVKITKYEDYLEGKDELNRLKNIFLFSDLFRSDSRSNLEIFKDIPLMSESTITENSDCLLLSTVHGVKGLEFKYVFLVSMQNNIFPSSFSTNQEEIEEEGRIAYVAFTRAKEFLYITSGSYDESFFMRGVEKWDCTEKRKFSFSNHRFKNFDI